MKYFIIILFVFLTTFGYSQNYGVKLIYNLASQTNYNPEVPEDGEFQWNYISGVGAEIWYDFNLFRRIKSNISLGFQQKGYKEIAQTGFIGPGGTPISNNILTNRLNVICASYDLAYVLTLSNNMELKPYHGLELNRIVSKSLESEMVWPIYDFYPVKYYEGNWRAFYLNYLIGIRADINNSISIEGGLSRSFTPIINIENLIVKDWIWYFKLGIPINSLLKE